MAIDTTDQNTPIVGEDGGASLTADDAEIPIEEEELAAGPSSTPDRQQGAQRQPGRQKGNAPSRKERRGAFDNVSKQLEEKLMGSVRGELSTLRSEFSQMLSGLRQQAAPQQQAPQQQGPDPFVAQLADIDAAREAELKLLQAHDRSKGAFDFTRYRKLENDRTALLARREAMQVLQSMGLTPGALRQLQQGNQNQRQPFSQEVVYTARFERLQEEFPHLADVKVAGQVGAYRRYLKQTGRPDTFETDREAAAHVMAQLGLSTRPVPRGRPGMYAAPGPGEGGGGVRQQREIRLPAAVVNALTPDERAMASKMLFANDGEA